MTAGHVQLLQKQSKGESTHHSVNGAIKLRQRVHHHALQASDAISGPAGHVLYHKSRLSAPGTWYHNLVAGAILALSPRSTAEFHAQSKHLTLILT